MKKILSILLIALMLVSAISITVFASDVDYTNGYWSINDTIDVTSWPNTYTTYSVYHRMLSNDNTVVGTIFVFNKDSSGNYVLQHKDSAGGGFQFSWDSQGNKKQGGYNGYFKHIEIPDISNHPNLLNWLLVNAEFHSYTCDGSTCPATDVNMDNVCDDCGMIFAVLRDYTPADFPSGYPAVPSVGLPNARYYLYRVISSDRIYIVVYPSTVTPTYDSTVQNGQLYFSESYGNYALTNNEWVLSSDDTPYSIGGNNSQTVENLYSSVQIYDEKGERFFPIPLWQEMEKVTEGEMTEQQTKIIQTMALLTACGIGSMALLISLILLRKKSLLFLGK